MDTAEILKNITFNLSSVAFSKVGAEWNYRNIISSFSRLYLVTRGEAFIYIGDKKIVLRKGYLYLVPSFKHCSYVCKNEMQHYYATFTIQLPGNLSIYQLFNFTSEVKATPLLEDYFKRLCEINPNRALPAGDPKIYQRTSSKNWNFSIEDSKRSMNTSGLLYLLLAEFIGDHKIDLEQRDSNIILNTLSHIHSHLHENLTVAKLAERCFLSTGHFTRKFKSLTELTPLDYINKHRIEKAQLLLNTTTQSCLEIGEACGFRSNAYFCKMFKKALGESPGHYRKNKV